MLSLKESNAGERIRISKTITPASLVADYKADCEKYGWRVSYESFCGYMRTYELRRNLWKTKKAAKRWGTNRRLFISEQCSYEPCFAQL